MEEEKKAYRAHCIVVSFPTRGHINPMLQFSKHLEHKGFKITLVTTRFIYKTIVHRPTPSSISVETISDGYDEGGMDQAENMGAYLDSFWKVGSQTLTILVKKLNASSCPVDCIIYDALMPWCLDVAKRFGLLGAVFFTESCAVGCIYHHVHRGLIQLPITKTEISLPGLPPLHPKDLPSLVYDFGSYPAALELFVGQFSNIDKADWVLCNTFYELEPEVMDWLAKIMPLMAIGPTIPSVYLDKQRQDDVDYGVSILKPNNGTCMNWLNDRPKGSVVYVSFGSLVALGVEQMKELFWGLKKSNNYFLWVIRASEEAKLPKNFVMETTEKGLVVSWCPQLEVLAHEAVGCFITHCGWNSTLEALSLGVPMLAMPQLADQITNAKYITDIWKMGIRAPVNENGIVTQEAIMHCIKEIMDGERGKEIKIIAEKWRTLAKEAVEEGGSSDININKFVANLVHS